MGFLLQRDGWIYAAANRKSRGTFVVDINIAGWRGCFSDVDFSILEFANGPSVRCNSALLSLPEYKIEVNPYERTFNLSSLSFSMIADCLPINNFLKSGLSFSGIKVKVYWLILNNEFSLDQAFLIVDGTATNFQYSEPDNVVNFDIVDEQLGGDCTFPPRAITLDTFPESLGINEESYGKCYPVIIGSVKKMPVLDITDDRTRYLVLDDPHGRISGTPVSKAYDGDNEIAVGAISQAADVDALGNTYWYADVTSDPSLSNDVTVDIDAGNAALVDAISFLLTYSEKFDVFDLNSLKKLSHELSALTFALVFNEAVDGGVIGAIKERLIKELPISIFQRGKKYYFQSLFWDRDIRKSLSTDTNILQTISSPTEISNEIMCNDFVVTAGISGLRGDSAAAVGRNRFNDALCATNAMRYGSVGRKEISLPDAADSKSATWMANWLVETFARKRVRVSYLCTFDVLDLNPWDTIQVFDHNMGWTHGPLFKIVGMTFGSTNGIILNLLSLDDYFDVYGINQTEDHNHFSFSLSGVTE